MKLLATISQSDVFASQLDDKANIDFETRLTGKAIIFDKEGRVALIGTNANHYLLLPGGGIDLSESIEDGVRRECLEEAGCKVALENPIGVVIDFRNRDKKQCISYCYTARLVGEKGALSLTDEETKNGLHVKWVSLEDAVTYLDQEVRELREGKVAFYNTGYNILRDSIFLREALTNRKAQ